MGDTCVTLTFDVAATGGLYSQLAGVLAGFAFAALVVVLTSRLTTGQGILIDAQTVHMLVSCFVGLILVSLTYAVLAGETTNAGRAAMVELVAATGFIAAGMLLLLSILALLRAVEKPTSGTTDATPGSARLFRLLLAHAVPLVLVASLYGGVDDYADARWPNQAFRMVDLVIVIAGLLVIVVPFVAYAPWPKPSDTKKPQDEPFAYTAVGLATTAALGTFLISASIDRCETLGQWFVALVVCVPVLFILAVSVHLVRSRRF